MHDALDAKVHVKIRPIEVSGIVFAEYLKAKLPVSPASSMPTEEVQKLRAELRAWVTAQPQQPENASDFIRRLRDEAQY